MAENVSAKSTSKEIHATVSVEPAAFPCAVRRADISRPMPGAQQCGTGTVRVRAVDLLRHVGGNYHGEHNSYDANGQDDSARGIGGLEAVDVAVGGIAGSGWMELERGDICVRVSAVLRDGAGLCADRPEDGRVVVQGGRWRGAGGWVRAGLVQHGPCRRLENPVNLVYYSVLAVGGVGA